MIVKFDHVSFSCVWGEETAVKNSFREYEEVFREENIENLSIKSEFMKSEAKKHHLYMLVKDGCYPIEITSYPACTAGRERLSIGSDEIRILTMDVKETEAFYKTLGFTAKDSVMTLKPLLDKTEIRLKIVPDGEIQQELYLDQQGIGIMAFVVDNAKKQKKQLENAGVYATDIQELVVNGKNLKIFFAKSNAGDLVELIGIR